MKKLFSKKKIVVSDKNVHVLQRHLTGWFTFNYPWRVRIPSIALISSLWLINILIS